MGIIPCAKGCHVCKDKESPPQHHQPSHAHSDDPLSKPFNPLTSQTSLRSLRSLDSPSHPPPSPLTRQCISTLGGHSSYVSALAVDGSSLYSGSSDREIRAWSSDDSSGGQVVAACKSAVKSLLVSGGKLFSAHQDRKIRVWRVVGSHSEERQGYRLLATLPTAGDRFGSLLLPGNYVRVRRHKKCTWVHHVDAVAALAASRDGSLLYSVSWDRSLKIWRTADYKCVESVSSGAHHDAVNAVVVSADGFVYTGSADKTVKVWKRWPAEKRHSLVGTLERHKSAVNALALTADGSVLYSGACDRSVVVWEREGGGGGSHMVVAGALRGHGKAVLCLAVVAELVCSGSADKTVRVWRRGGGKSYSCLAVLEGHRGPVKCLAAAAAAAAAAEEVGANLCGGGGGGGGGGGNSHIIYTGSLDCDIKVWKVQVAPLSE